MSPSTNPTPAPVPESGELLFGAELKQWLAAQGPKVVTLVAQCAASPAAPADTPDADRYPGLAGLREWLREQDPERGQITAPLVYGRLEFECRADKLPLPEGRFPFLKRIVRWFTDEPARRPADAERLYPFRSAAHVLRSSRLFAATEQLADPVGATAFGPIARAARWLARDEAPAGQPVEELNAWVRACQELVRVAGARARTALGRTDLPQADRYAAEELLHDADAAEAKGGGLPPTATELAKRLLDKAVADLGASGYMMCVLDPATEEDYRVVLAEGVKYREMLVGFSGFGSALWDFGDEDEVYCTNQKEALEKLPKNRWFQGSKGRKQWVAYARMLENPEKQMFGPYFVREGLSSLVYLQDQYEGKRCFSVYLNFTRPMVFGNRVRAYLRQLRTGLAQLFPRFREEFCLPIDARRVNQLLQTAQALAALPNKPEVPGKPSFEEALGECFTRFLRTALDVLGIPFTEGFATLSGFDADQFLLYPVTHTGTIEPKSAADAAHLKYQEALLCDGVVSWVALHRRPILIPDVNAPHIRGFAKQIDPRVQSEMALPMLAEGELLGVLNFESFRPNAFTKTHLVLMSLVANSIALEWSECLRRRLHDGLERMANVVRSPAPVTAWCDAVLRTFRAHDMSLWRVSRSVGGNPAFEPVTAGGAARPVPRPNGWTNCVVETRQIVCLTDTNPDDLRDYKVFLWKNGSWMVPSNEDALAKDADGGLLPLNPALIGGPMLCLVGLPLVKPEDNRCFGVLWLKYRNKPPRSMFDSPLIRHAFLVPFAPPPRPAKPSVGDAVRPAYYPVVNPRLMDELVGGVRYSSLTVLDAPR